MLREFILSEQGNFAHQGGNFYARTKSGQYRQLECYLPSSVGTYGEPLRTTALRILSDFEDGVRQTRWAIGGSGRLKTTLYSIVDSRLKADVSIEVRDANTEREEYLA